MSASSCVPVEAPVAQGTEHRSSEPSVGGSNPSGSAGVEWGVLAELFLCQCAPLFYPGLGDFF